MLTTRQLSAFLKSDRAKTAFSERTVEKAMHTLRMIEIGVGQQGLAVDWFALMAVVFLPLNFCTSVS